MGYEHLIVNLIYLKPNSTCILWICSILVKRWLLLLFISLIFKIKLFIPKYLSFLTEQRTATIHKNYF